MDRRRAAARGFVDLLARLHGPYTPPVEDVADAVPLLLLRAYGRKQWTIPRLAQTVTVSQKPADLFLAFGSNEGRGTIYVQVFDAVRAPQNGDIPRLSTKVLAGAPWSLSFSRGGPTFEHGIVFAVSSTPDRYTFDASQILIQCEYGETDDSVTEDEADEYAEHERRRREANP